jgi:Zn-dependent protease with chaperone function
MTVALAAIVAAGIGLPHALRLQRAAPVTAVMLWLSSLALRALAGVLAVIFLLFFLPRTESFDRLTHWCARTVPPGFADTLHIEGHRMGDLTLFVPGAALVVSLALVCVRNARGARTARRLLVANRLARGPQDSIIVGGPEIVFAVAGVIRPSIVVSAGALASLDDAELAAALDHERGHIARRHRFVLLAVTALSAIGWVFPGTRRAAREIAFHLERDADWFALRRRNDRLALASVICKSAIAVAPAKHPAIASLGSTGIRERLGQLLEEQPPRISHSAAVALNALAATMVVVTLLLSAAVPAAAVAGADGDAHRGHHGHCQGSH